MARLVSILIPAYNAEQWIGDTVNSALAQSWPRKEIIVVDDGSTDRTLSAAQPFAKQGVKIVHQANQGAAAARNHAYALCKGDFIQWLDADDLLSPDKIERQMARMKDSGLRTIAACSWGHFIFRPHRAKFVPSSVWCDLDPVEWMLRYFEENAWLQTATWLIPRALAEAAGPWDTRLLGDDDGEYFSRILMASDRIRFVPEARVYYRRGLGTLSHVGLSSRKLEAHLLSMRMRIEHLLGREDSVRVRKACLKYLQRYLIYFYPERQDLVAQMNQLAEKLGGELCAPQLPRKYAAIQKIFGWTAAKKLQLTYNRNKSQMHRTWDRLACQLGL